MAVSIQYCGIQRVKHFVSRYLTAAFKANEKGVLLFTDGTNKIEFSKPVTVVSMHSWVDRELPAVLIGPVTATYTDRTFSKNVLRKASLDDADEYNYYGGDLDLEIPLYVRTTTIIENDNLCDTVAILIAKKDAKDYFLLQDIKITTPPRVGAAHEVHEPAIDFPMYETPIDLSLHATWVEWEEIGERLIDIIVDIDAELNL